MHFRVRLPCNIEPSAGSGAFLRHDRKVQGYDIAPDHDRVISANFLTLEMKDLPDVSNVGIIGNPPFGSQSNSAFAFLKRSFTLADYVGFVLPLSFKKVSYQNRVPLTHTCVYSEDLPSNSFTLDGVDHDVPCCFQVWIRQDRKVHVSPLTCSDFDWVKPNEADISIQRVGSKAGLVSLTPLSKSPSSHYFVRCNTITPSEFIETCNRITFDTHNTVGPKSISKGEFISLYLAQKDFPVLNIITSS